MRRHRGQTFLACLLLGVAVAPSAIADTFKPTRFDDPAPANKCKPDDCSLREAVRAANNQGGRDEVVLKEGTYELEILGSGPPFESGDLDIFTGLELRGKGARQTKIDANGIDRVISNGCGISTTGSVTIERLTLRGGDPGANPFNCTGAGDASLGGGILAVGKALKLQKVTVKGNEAALGGGIFSSAEKLTIKDSTITKNNAAEGGGLDLPSRTPAPVTLIRSSTISGNFASKGGGILADGAQFIGEDPSVQLVNSTVAANDASAEGGGIMADNSAAVNLANSTVAHNIANSDNVGAGDGGGVYQHSNAAFGLTDSLIAGNSVGQGGGGSQCAGTFQGAGGIVVQLEAGTLCSISQVNFAEPADAMIGPLAQNGGPTKTVALLPGSAALGFADTCPATDQRGFARPDVDCDAGAFELP